MGEHARRSQAQRDRTLAEQRYKCDICVITFTSIAKQKEHLATGLRQRKAAACDADTPVGHGGEQDLDYGLVREQTKRLWTWPGILCARFEEVEIGE
ncbi:hypothetical protein NW761_000269 [Fusarium oxysporum]|nr:hypothetical protein NW758_002384 [Fusarium oxysporum]KAJ4106399.1 hypothetical protein NW761_000269 [Fusarium oxysporum]